MCACVCAFVYVRVYVCARCTNPVDWFRANNPSGKGPLSLAEKILYAHLENPLQEVVPGKTYRKIMPGKSGVRFRGTYTMHASIWAYTRYGWFRGKGFNLV